MHPRLHIWVYPAPSAIKVCISTLIPRPSARTDILEENIHSEDKHDLGDKELQLLTALCDELYDGIEDDDLGEGWYPGESDWAAGGRMGAFLGRFDNKELKKAGVIEKSVVSMEKLAKFVIDKRFQLQGPMAKSKGEKSINFCYRLPSYKSKNTLTSKRARSP